jgi:putative DNA primase/helicase
MNLRSMARALGGVVEGDRVICPGPGHSKRDRSLSVWIDPNSPTLLRVHSFSGDDWKRCMDHACSMLNIKVDPSSSKGRTSDFGSENRGSTPREGATPEDDSKSQFALKIWNECTEIVGTVVERYLRSRGITLMPEPYVVRYHQSCPFRLADGTAFRVKAMVALFRDIHTDIPRSIHRTALADDGSKLDLPAFGSPKKMLGPTRGAAIKLDRDSDVLEGLGICEGIETALHVRPAFRPLWALGSATSMSAFPVLSGIDALTIFSDDDPAGIGAANNCRLRWLKASREVRVLQPEEHVDGP